jgi:hypothetical protein
MINFIKSIVVKAINFVKSLFIKSETNANVEPMLAIEFFTPAVIVPNAKPDLTFTGDFETDLDMVKIYADKLEFDAACDVRILEFLLDHAISKKDHHMLKTVKTGITDLYPLSDTMRQNTLDEFNAEVAESFHRMYLSMIKTEDMIADSIKDITDRGIDFVSTPIPHGDFMAKAYKSAANGSLRSMRYTISNDASLCIGYAYLNSLNECNELLESSIQKSDACIEAMIKHDKTQDEMIEVLMDYEAKLRDYLDLLNLPDTVKDQTDAFVKCQLEMMEIPDNVLHVEFGKK